MTLKFVLDTLKKEYSLLITPLKIVVTFPGKEILVLLLTRIKKKNEVFWRDSTIKSFRNSINISPKYHNFFSKNEPILSAMIISMATLMRACKFSPNNLFLFLAGWMSVYLTYSTGMELPSDPTLYYQCLLVNFSMMIYFIKDFYYMITQYNPADILYFPHHFVGLVSCITGFILPQYLMLIVAYFTFEVSTPVLNYSKYLRKNNCTGTVYILSLTAFVLLFTLSRIIFGSYVTMISYLSVPTLFVPFPIVLQGLNYYWFYRIIRMIVKMV